MKFHHYLLKPRSLENRLCLIAHRPWTTRFHYSTFPKPAKVRQRTFESTSDGSETPAPAPPTFLRKVGSVRLNGASFPFSDDLEIRYLRRGLRRLLEKPEGANNHIWRLEGKGKVIEKTYLFESPENANVRLRLSTNSIGWSIRVIVVAPRHPLIQLNSGIR